MRTILLWALFMISYRLFAPDFENGSCAPFSPWVEHLAVPLVLAVLLLDLFLMARRYQQLLRWQPQRQRYLRMRAWVKIHLPAEGRV